MPSVFSMTDDINQNKPAICIKGMNGGKHER